MFFKEFHVTGMSKDGKRFILVLNSFQAAVNINLYQGSVWGVNEKGKRTLLKRVFN